MTNDDHLIKEAENITTRAEFVSFLKKLGVNYKQKDGSWENSDLESYLEALGGVTEDVDGYYENMELKIDPEKPTWRIFAELLLAARVYE